MTPCEFTDSEAGIKEFPVPPARTKNIWVIRDGKSRLEKTPLHRIIGGYGVKASDHRDYSRLLEAQRRLGHFCWMFGMDIVIDSKTYVNFVKDYSALAMDILFYLVGQPSTGSYDQYSKSNLLAAYRFRRCFPAGESPSDVLDFVQSYATPLPSKLYSNEEMHRLLQAGIGHRSFIVNRPEFRSIKSNKATLGCMRGVGGFNTCVAILGRGPPIVKLPSVFFDEEGSYLALEVAKASHRDRSRYMSAVGTAVDLMRKIKREPIAFVSAINERSGKTRVPTLAEGFCQVLSQYISDIGKTIQARIFPLTKGKKIKFKFKKGSIFLSGDYKDSTSYIYWEAIKVAYYHYFRYCGFDKSEMDLHMEIVDFLVGPHRFFKSKEERSRYADAFKRRSAYVKPKLGFDTNAYYMKNGVIAPLIGVQVADGSSFGTIQPDLHILPRLEEVCEHVLSFRLNCETVLSVRGILMCYSLAAPALHAVGAMPHWKFPSIPHHITGDDNASIHRSEASIDKLEAEKLLTGMVPHDKEKSARGRKGLLLAERLFLAPAYSLCVKGDRKKEYTMRESPNFPIRILFPQDETLWHAVTMPEAAYNNLTEVMTASARVRILGYVYWKFKPVYDKLSKMGISVGGPNGLFPSLAGTASTINGPYGLTRAELFKRPGVGTSSFGKKEILGMLSTKVDIPWEGVSGYKGITNTFSSLDAVSDALRPYGPTSNYDVITLTGEVEFFDAIRGNIRKAKLERKEQNFLYTSISCTGVESQVFSFEADWGAVPHDLPSKMDEARILNNSLLERIPLPVHVPISYWASSFRSNHPDGLSMSQLYDVKNHFFIDCANLEEKCRRPPAGAIGFSRPEYYSLDWYFETFRRPKIGYSSVIWFIIEIPGITICKYLDYGENVLIRASPRRNGRAGADLEFSMLAAIISQNAPNSNLYYCSKDSDWARTARQFGISHKWY